MKRAFTLIELLIVIAIIAILALIAVPNFLEAQVRAKVSRVHADQRTLATALESYLVDWGHAPIGLWELLRANPKFLGLADLRLGQAASYAMLTTPVGYVGSLPRDPFSLHGTVDGGESAAYHPLDDYYMYGTMLPADYSGRASSSINIKGHQMGFSWVVWTLGPSRKATPGGAFTGAGCVRALTKTPSTATAANYPDIFYDATNGTLSFGWIMRTNKGLL